MGLVALGLTAGGLAGMQAQAIDGNPPTGPGNIEVFPKRDMVAIEGYAEYAGKRATITVTRDGAPIGSAAGTVDSTGFLEVNHPGGVCWGAGTDLQVTPDIQGGDEVRVDFADTGGRWDGAVTQDVVVTGVERRDAERRLVITGTYGPGVDMPGADPAADPGRFGVEIVNPAMRDATSGIGERAIGWPGEPGEATTGYTVAGEVTGTDDAGGAFTVTYTFTNAGDLDLAEEGEIVGLAWQAEAPADLGVEAQYGMTLYEFHEAAGPGMGGCPAGPDEQRPISPDTYTGKGAGPGSIEVTWDAGTVLPTAPEITGYTVRAVSGEDETGKRLPAGARSTTITGLTPGEIYDVEVAARSAEAGESWTPAAVRVRAADHVPPSAEANTARVPDADGKYLPLVTNQNGDFGVHLDPAPGVLGAEVHYTTNGSAPTTSSPTFRPGDPSIQVRQDTTLKWVVVDSGNIVGPEGSEFFDIVEADPATQPAPTIAGLTPLSGAVDVVVGTIPDVEAYRVQAYDEAGTVRVGSPLGVAQPTETPLPATVTRRVPGLTNGVKYRFTVAARYGTVWSAESATSEPVAPVAAPRADAGSDQSALRGGVVTLDGSASVGAVGWSWAQVRPLNADGTRDPLVALAGATTDKPTFRLPLRTSPTSDDGTYQFRLTITLADGTTRSASTTVTARADAVVATRARWRAGDELRMSGTGSQQDAVLTFRDASATGPVIGTATVVNGAWAAPEVVVNLSDGSIYVWSDHGFVGRIQTTR